MTMPRLPRWSAPLCAAALALLLSACIPIPVISVNPSPVYANEEVTFSGDESMVSTMPENNRAIAFDWNFGDGNSGDGKTVTHTYTRAGTYKVTLTVVDSAGREGRASEEVVVKSARPKSASTDEADAASSN